MNKLTVYVLIFSLSMLISPCLSGDFFISQSGSNFTGEGTKDNPWKTITFGLSKVDGSESDPIKFHVGMGVYDISSGEMFPLNMKSHVSIIGESRNTTIIDAEGANASVFLCNSVDNTILESLTITGGDATKIGPEKYGGGIYCNSSLVDIINCNITGNKTKDLPGYGGGLCLVWSSVTITNCEITQNSTPGVLGFGGGIHCTFSITEISNSSIINNASRKGGAISCYASNPDIFDTLVYDNLATEDGGGIYCLNNSAPRIINCRIYNNNANKRGGGVYCEIESSAIITNCEIVNNFTSSTYGNGGGIYVWTSNPIISNCTIANNEAVVGGGITSYTSGTQIKNSILWNNTGGGINGSASISFSDIQGGYTGSSNLDVEPLFVSGENGNYYLSQVESGQSSDSECVDAGSTMAGELGFDILTTRTDGLPDTGLVDLGYHYKTSFTPTPTPTPGDQEPILTNERVIPSYGYQNQTYEYLISYKDLDGGIPPLAHININGENREMRLKSGVEWDGTYNLTISGYDLKIGKNHYYFLFRDDELNEIRHPLNDSFEGPEIYPLITFTPTTTSSVTSTPSSTVTPVLKSCFRVSSPQEFHFNTIILSWFKVEDADHYQFEYILQGNKFSLDIVNNWVRLIANSDYDWKLYESFGPVLYRVSAYDSNGNIIEGPTDWSVFSCKQNTLNSSSKEMIVTGADPGCLQITNPGHFYFNSIVLSWTPIRGTDHYILEYKYRENIHTLETRNYWFMSIFTNVEIWEVLKSTGALEFRVSAIDSNGNLIDGPTEWSEFTCH